jgi:hypothetical protein
VGGDLAFNRKFHIFALFIVQDTVAREFEPLGIQNTVHFSKEVYL